MLIEGILAVLALTAVSTFTSKEFSNLLINEGAVPAFSKGVANFIVSIPLLSIPVTTATSFVALAVAAFALTTLDTTTRLGRYVFQEFFEMADKSESNKFGTNRFVATAVTVAAGVALTFSGQTRSIWPVFGSANQLLAGLTLLTITVWLVKRKKSFIFTLIPTLFMFSFTLTALVMLFYNNIFLHKHYALAVLSVILFILAIVLAVKSYPILANGGKAEKVKEKLVTH